MDVKVTQANGGFETIEVRRLDEALAHIARRMKRGYSYGGKVTFEVIEPDYSAEAARDYDRLTANPAPGAS